MVFGGDALMNGISALTEVTPESPFALAVT